MKNLAVLLIVTLSVIVFGGIQMSAPVEASPMLQPAPTQDIGNRCHQNINDFTITGLCDGLCTLQVTTLNGASYPDCGGCGYWYRATWTCPGGTYVVDYNGILECDAETGLPLLCPEGGLNTIKLLAKCGGC